MVREFLRHLGFILLKLGKINNQLLGYWCSVIVLSC